MTIVEKYGIAVDNSSEYSVKQLARQLARTRVNKWSLVGQYALAKSGVHRERRNKLMWRLWLFIYDYPVAFMKKRANASLMEEMK